MKPTANVPMIGGTRTRTTTMPLTSPTATPNPMPSNSTRGIDQGSAVISCTARKAQKFITKGIERSMPPSPEATGNI